MLRQTDLTNQQPNITIAGSAHTNTWAFGTCAVALRTTKDGTESFKLFDILRQVALLVVSCSSQKTNFLGGTLSIYPGFYSYVEVFYQQVDSSTPEALLRNAVTTIPVRCWDWNAPGSSTLNPFVESDCNANIVEILADTDFMKKMRSTTGRPFWVRYYDTCMISLYVQGTCVEHFQYIQVLQVAAQVLEMCRSRSPAHRGKLGGYRLLRRHGCVDAVISGTGSLIPPQLPGRITLLKCVPSNSPCSPFVVSHSDGKVPAVLLVRSSDAKAVLSNVNDDADVPTPPIYCRVLHPGRLHRTFPYMEEHCAHLTGRIFNSPNALVPREWSTEDFFFRTMLTCGITMEAKPTAGFTTEWFALGDIAYIASLIISECHQYGPPHLGGIRDVTQGSAFQVSVFGIGPFPMRAVPGDFSPEHASLVEAVPSKVSRRASLAGATPPALMLDTPLNAKCFGSGPTIPSHFRPFIEADCNTLMRRLVAEHTAMIPQEFTTAQAVRHWMVGTCRISFETRLDHHFFSRELHSLYEIVHVARMIIDVCRRFGLPHLGGTRDAWEGSAFRVIVRGSHLSGPALNSTRENSTSLPLAS